MLAEAVAYCITGSMQPTHGPPPPAQPAPPAPVAARAATPQRKAATPDVVPSPIAIGDAERPVTAPPPRTGTPAPPSGREALRAAESARMREHALPGQAVVLRPRVAAESPRAVYSR